VLIASWVGYKKKKKEKGKKKQMREGGKN